MLEQPKARRWGLSGICLVTISIHAVCSMDACSLLSNPDCQCLPPSPSSPKADVTCRLLSNPSAPIFKDHAPDDMISLGIFDISSNALKDVPCNLFHGVSTVDYLDLSNNSLYTIPAVLSELKSVRELNMSCNEMESVSFNQLATIKGLQLLDLSRNNLTHFSEKPEIPVNTNFDLKTLNLSWNGIQRINGSVFASMSHLKSLTLSHNLLREINDAMFSKIQFSLISLDLSHNLLRSIWPLALQHLQHLRTLNLGHNDMNNINAVQFPPHLRHLDLSHCALTIINHCQLSGLADLSFIGLRGNDLKCTCQLYLLLKWYQDKHHEVGYQQDGTISSNWTCVTANNPTPAPSTPLILLPRSHDSKPDPPVHSMRRVLDLQECQDTESHCQTLEHSQHHLKGSSKMLVNLAVVSSDNNLMASWTFQENGVAIVDGFMLHYMPADAQPINSPIISNKMRSYIMRPSQLEKHFRVCLDVLSHERVILHQECLSFQEKTNNFMVGILAGLVFLIPSMGILIYVYVRDNQIRKDREKQLEDTEVETCPLNIIYNENPKEENNMSHTESRWQSEKETPVGLSQKTEKDPFININQKDAAAANLQLGTTDTDGQVPALCHTDSTDIWVRMTPSSQSTPDKVACVPYDKIANEQDLKDTGQGNVTEDEKTEEATFSLRV